jgi:phosphoribosylaminoimidazole-succinocarboxamide synthase
MKARAQSLILEGKEKAAETVRQDLFAEQSARRLYTTNKRDLLIQEFIAPQGTEGDRNATGSQRASRLPILRNRISSYLFEYIRGFHVATHFVGEREGAEMLVKYAEPLPLLVKIFNAADEQWPERFGPAATGRMELPVIEHYLLASGGSPVWVNEYHLYAFNLLKPDEFKQVNRLASKVNAVLRGLSERRDLFLSGLQLSFGRFNDQVIVTGELSNLTCRFEESPSSARAGNHAHPASVPQPPPGPQASQTWIESDSEEGLERLYSRLKLNG